MSRIDTQSDRLLRGTEGFERQRTFLVQPERFAARQDNSASRLIQALGQTVGVVGEVRLAQERKEQAVRSEEEKVIFNSTVSNLEVLQKQIEANPQDSEVQERYARSLQSAYNTFDPGSDNGASIRRSFPIPDQLKQKARKTLDSAQKAVQGGYVQSAKVTASTYESDAELTRLGSYDFDSATSVIYRELLDSFSVEDREKMTEQTRLQIEAEARSKAKLSRDIYDTAKSVSEDRSESAARLSIIGQAVASGKAPLLTELVDHAEVYNIQDEVLFDEVSDDLIDNLKVSLIDGSVDDITRAWSAVSQMEESLGDLYPSVRIKLAESRQDASELAAERDASRFLELGRDAVQTGFSKEEASVLLNSSAVDAYNSRLGTAHNVSSLDEITPDNELGIFYKKSLQRALNTAVSEVDDSIDTVTQSLSTIQNKEQATPSMVRSVVNMAPEEWVRVVDRLQEATVSSGLDSTITDSTLDILEQSKTDPAARSEVMSQLFANSIHYGDVFDTLVGDNLQLQNLSQNGLREVIGFVGSDVKRVSALIGNEEQVYALSRTIDAVSNNPDIDLVTEYKNNLATVQSVQFDTGKDTAGFITFLQTKEFAESFHGDKNTRMSKEDLRTLLAVVDISSIDSDDPDIVSTVVKQQLSNSGFSVIQNKLLKSSPARLSSNPSIPEAVGVDLDNLSDKLNTRDSSLVRYLGTKAGEQDKDLHDLALEKITDSPTLVRGTGLSQSITKDMLFDMVDQGRVSFYADSTKADAKGTPIFMLLADDSGRPVRPVQIMRVDFRDPIIIGTSSASKPSAFDRIGEGLTTNPAISF